jgi:hypothetical protein
MASTWITGNTFPAIVGKSYEVSFGNQVTHQGRTGNWTAKIRIDGPGTAQWFDLDAGAPLDPGLARYTVAAYREL